MTSRLSKILFIFILGIGLPTSIKADNSQSKEAQTLRKERIYIKEGNKLYNDKKYSEAEVKYRKAIEENKASDIGIYNLALSLINQAKQGDDVKSPANPLNQGDSLLRDLVQMSKNIPLVSRAYYNLGNISFNKEQYQESIEYYKACLRRNPNDDQARQNLRLAQKKLQQQQQDKNKDQNKDKDKDKDKNKDQNKDKQDQNKDKQDQNKQNNQDKNQQQNKDQSQSQPQPGDNSEQILNAVQSKESATQQKINGEMLRQKQQERQNTRNKW